MTSSAPVNATPSHALNSLVAAAPACVLEDLAVFERFSVDDICALTEAATAVTFPAPGLDAAQLRANRNVVERSGGTAMTAAQSDNQYIAALADNRGLAGFVISTRHGPNDLELDWLMVHPRHHGTGIADRLMSAGLAWLGADQPIWLTVIRHNTRAIRFYERHEFVIDPGTPTAHAVPHWIMRRREASRPTAR
ncbi:MAG TPA: GNAT family N-acetyltransferase [Devosiaceae bacterium]